MQQCYTVREADTWSRSLNSRNNPPHDSRPKRTLRRHATKPQAAEYGPADMRNWYRDLDLLPSAAEHIVPADMSLDETVHRIMTDAGLSTGAIPHPPRD
jgi:hypothetical protein